MRKSVAVFILCIIAWSAVFAAQKAKPRTKSKAKAGASKASMPKKDVIQPAAKALLDQVFKKYAGMQSARIESSMQMKMQMKGMPAPPMPAMVTTIEFKRPDKFRSTTSGGPGGAAQTAIHNGEKSWIYVETLKQYTESSGSGGASYLFDQGIDPIGVLSGPVAGDKGLLAGLRHAVLLPSRDSAGAKVVVMRASIADMVPKGAALPAQAKDMLREPIQISLHVDDDLIVRRLEFDMTDMVKAQMKSMPSGKGQLPLVEKMLMVVTFTNVELNPELLDDIFIFTPPEGAQLVKQFDFGQMRGEDASLEGKPAPEFTLTSADGKKISLKDLRGKPVLLNFYAEF